MLTKIKFSMYDPKQIAQVIKIIQQKKKQLPLNAQQLIIKLVEIARRDIEANLAMVQYDGKNDAIVKSKITKTRGVIGINGESVLFIEFGSGAFYSGTQHPSSGELGMGAGTFPGKGNWDNPYGWVYIGEQGTHGRILRESGGKVYVHTRGNPPNPIVYNAGLEVLNAIPQIINEVYKK